jgi:hypothetical protein
LKLDQTLTKVTGNLEVAETVKMGLHHLASAHLIRMFTNQYSNPYRAALQEYSSNAHDSHNRAGQTKPVSITLPDRLSPNLIIQDFGIGMDRQGLRDYGQYGFSDKNSGNDEIGGFGIGSKSGLAIASQFTVRAVKDGLGNVAIVGFGSDGSPELKFLNAEPVPTDDENGVTITIPTSEVAKFTDAIEKNIFFGWKPGTIVVNGKPTESELFDPTKYTQVQDLGWVKVDAQKNQGYGYRYSTSGHAVVGPVYYSIDWNQIDEDQKKINEELRSGYLRGVVMNVPIGSVDLTPSREDLIYSKRTRKALLDATLALIEDAKATYHSQIASAATFREAIKIAEQADNFGFGDDTYAYNGMLLTPKKYDGDYPMLTVSRLVDSWSSKRGTTQRAESSAAYLSDSRSLIFTVAKRQSILVVGSTETKKFSKYKTLHEGIKHVKNYLTYREEQDSNFTPEKAWLYFTNHNEYEIDPALLAAFSEVVTFEEVEENALEGHRAALKAARDARKLLAPTQKRDKTEVRVWEHGIGSYSERTLADLDKKANYILLQREMDTVESRAHRAVTTITGSTDHRGLYNIAHLLRQKGYIFLLLNKTWDIKPYEELLPNRFTLGEAVDKEALAVIGSVTQAQVQATTDRKSGEYNWTRHLEEIHIDAIERVETRDWIRAMQVDNTTSAFSFLETMQTYADTLGLDKTKYKLNVTAQSSPGNRYTLIKGMYSINKRKALVEYINMKDERIALEEREARKAARAAKKASQ